MEDERVVKKMLRVVPSRFNQIVCSIEMFTDFKKMSLEELVGRLRVAEERCGGVELGGKRTGQLILTEEQWKARVIVSDATRSACVVARRRTAVAAAATTTTTEAAAQVQVPAGVVEDAIMDVATTAASADTWPRTA
jgi:hypothetical protein